MRQLVRKNGKNSGSSIQHSRSTLPPLPEGMRCSQELLAGVESIRGAARLSIAAVSDMLSGVLTPKQAAVINTTASLVMKGCSLGLRYGKAATEASFCLPGEV